MARYLYGARTTDDRYYKTFEDNYGKIGDQIASKIKSANSNNEIMQSLKKIMVQGIEKSRTIALAQVKSQGYKEGNIKSIDEFVKHYNAIAADPEKYFYRALDILSSDIAYEILKKVDKNINNLNMDQIIKNALESKIVNVDNDLLPYFKGISSALEENQQTREVMKTLIEKRVTAAKITEVEGKKSVSLPYSSDYAGKIGESTLYLMGSIGRITEDTISEMIGTKGKKGDNKLGTIVISNKNYGIIRNNFEKISKSNDEDLLKSFADISIQSTGQLSTVINNFNKTGINLLKSIDEDDFYTYIMNALYFRNYGKLDFYNTAVQLMDILTNIYAYVFMVQGTTKQIDYKIKNLNEESRKTMPGFINFTGQGLVPIYKILIELEKNFESLFENQTRASRKGVYTFLEMSGATKGIREVDYFRPKAEEEKESLVFSNNLYYRNTKSIKNATAEDTLKNRYETFSPNIKTTVKIQIRLNTLANLTRV